MAILRGCRLRPVEAVQMWLAVAEIGRAGVPGGRLGGNYLASPTASPVAS